MLAPHHRSVREAIAMYRQALDANPVRALKKYAPTAEADVARAAAAYLDVKCYMRVAPGLLNSEQDVEALLRALA